MLVEPDRRVGRQPVDDPGREPRLRLREGPRPGVFGVARLPGPAPAGGEVAVEVDPPAVEPGLGGEPVGVEVGDEEDVRVHVGTAAEERHRLPSRALVAMDAAEDEDAAVDRRVAHLPQPDRPSLGRATGDPDPHQHVAGAARWVLGEVEEAVVLPGLRLLRWDPQPQPRCRFRRRPQMRREGDDLQAPVLVRQSQPQHHRVALVREARQRDPLQVAVAGVEREQERVAAAAAVVVERVGPAAGTVDVAHRQAAEGVARRPQRLWQQPSLAGVVGADAEGPGEVAAVSGGAVLGQVQRPPAG